MKITQMVASLAATTGIATIALVGGTGSADAAPSPSAKVCVAVPGGQPYSGPITLQTNGWWIFPAPVATKNADANGCAVFGKLKYRTEYWIHAAKRIEECAEGRLGSGETFQFGNERTLWAMSGHKFAPKTGQMDFGRLTVRETTRSCAD